MDKKNKINNPFINEELQLFLELCLWEKGIRQSDPKIKADMVEDLMPRLQDWLWQAIFPQLKNEDLPDWKKLMAGEANPESIYDFFKAKLPKLDEIIENALKEFKDIYVSA